MGTRADGGLGCESPRRDQGRSDAGLAARLVDVDAAVALIRDYGHQDGAAYYAGVRVDAAEIVVFRRSAPAFDSAVVSLAPDLPIRFVDAVHSRRELSEARGLVWAAPGASDILAVSLAVDGSTLVVVVSGEVEAAQAWFDRGLPGLVRVEHREGR